MHGMLDRHTTITDAGRFHQINRRIQNIRAGKLLSTQHCQVPIEHPWDEIKRVAMDLRDAIMKLKETKEKRPRRQIEALQKLSDIFNNDLDKAEQQYVHDSFLSRAPTSKSAVRTVPRVHGRVSRNNTPGVIPTSEGGGKRGQAEDANWSLTKAEQERTNEFKWSRVPTYEGG